MLYHKLHWEATGGAEFLLGAAPPPYPPLNRPCFLLQENNVVLSFSAGFSYLGRMCTVVMQSSALTNKSVTSVLLSQNPSHADTRRE